MTRPTDFTRESSAQTRRFDAQRDRLDSETTLPESDDTGQSYEASPDWAKLGLFGAGLAIGAALGAAAALLLAPRTGEETRELLGRRARHLGHRAADRWDDFRGDLRWARRRGRRHLRRGVTKGRWRLEDAWDHI